MVAGCRAWLRRVLSGVEEFFTLFRHGVAILTADWSIVFHVASQAVLMVSGFEARLDFMVE
jgi:hypothetical protein